MTYNFGIYPNENFYSYIQRVEEEFEHKLKHEGVCPQLVDKIVEIFETTIFARPDFLEEVNTLLETKIDKPTVNHALYLCQYLKHRLMKKLNPTLQLPEHLKILEK